VEQDWPGFKGPRSIHGGSAGNVGGIEVGAGEDVAVDINGVGPGQWRLREGGRGEEYGDAEAGLHGWSLADGRDYSHDGRGNAAPIMGHPIYGGPGSWAARWAVSRRVRRMRRRAALRPVGSYHSWRVWVPPPRPPAPMAIAGIPSERGMLASVEPRLGSVRRFRWRSTARRVLRRGESPGRVPPGRS